MQEMLTDLQLIDRYCEKCIQFVDPFLLREIMKRGLYNIINYLPGQNAQERKAVARARLGAAGKTFGDAEIDDIASTIQRCEALRSVLNQTNMADAHTVLPILEELREHTSAILNYYKEVKVC